MPESRTLQEAKKRIEEALEADARELDLRGLHLANLPESLEQLLNLEQLLLGRNRLTTVPDWLGQLTHLQTLQVSDNQLTALPESLGQLSQLQVLDLAQNHLTALPESLGQLSQLQRLDVANNILLTLPESLGQLSNLRILRFSHNIITAIPEFLSRLSQLQALYATRNRVAILPDAISQLSQLQTLQLSENLLRTLPTCILSLKRLEQLDLNGNPLYPELAAANDEGLEAVKRYLQAKADAQVVLNEAKLILIGEGEVGKSSLLGALRDDPWQENRPTTHGIEIKPVTVPHPKTGAKLTLNGWDFGGQRVYRPTHQLFFSAPAVYLVVWKPREGPQQGFVAEWIKLIQYRAAEAKIVVVATHGGPKARQPDIDRQELWDLFGRDRVTDFLLVQSKPEVKTGERKGLAELKEVIARVASKLPEVGRTVPKRWADARRALEESGEAYLSVDQVFSLCREHRMEEAEADDFIRISHRLGHLIHYEHDPILRDIVVLKPDWLATAISYVLDDEQTRADHGLVRSERLTALWDDPARGEARYPARLHPVFLRLMERFDLCYRIASPEGSHLQGASLIGQLVPDVRPDPIPGWPSDPTPGDQQQIQICRIVEAKSAQPATAEGLFYQLIVRLHKYSLGRANYHDSVHWQRGLVLQDDYGARALLEYVGSDVRITVRSPYPERFLAVLTYEVQWLVENFWSGLRCHVMVPCLNNVSCSGRFDVRMLLENKRTNRPEQPCPVCNEWQSIELLLHNAPTAQPNPLWELLENSAETMKMLANVRVQLAEHRTEVLGRFDGLDVSNKVLVTKVEAAYAGLIQTMTDEAKDGPRLFSLTPIRPGFFDRPTWVSAKFQLALWCEHSRLPLRTLYGAGDQRGTYELTLRRDWITEAAPFLKLLASTLSLVVPVAASVTKLALDEATYKAIEKQLDLSQRLLDSVLQGGARVGEWMAEENTAGISPDEGSRGRGAVLRQLHAWLKEKDPGFGGLVRVQNKRQEFLWVHPRFEAEY